ncbi:MAG TPA: PTS sugar transporter subunit IIA [Casimicrobiaceae bacterium]|nr:PTS sugar transporter subunit IIA [Casimicrobiaceae bacterium]
MNRIAQLLPEANIVLGVEAGTKKRLFEQIAQLFEQRAQLPRSEVLASLSALLVPEKATDEHLQLLSELAEMFSEQDFRDHIAAATDAAGVHRLFHDWVPEPQ